MPTPISCTEKYSSGDVCEQLHSLGYAERGQSKRAIRSVQPVLGYAEHCKFAFGKHCASRLRQQDRRGDADSRTSLQEAFLTV